MVQFNKLRRTQVRIRCYISSANDFSNLVLSNIGSVQWPIWSHGQHGHMGNLDLWFSNAQNLCCPHEEVFGHRLSIERVAKTLIKLCRLN